MVTEMMIVVILSRCPQSLRGDLTKWLIEVDTLVFVGKITARIKDLLWKRIVDSCEDGKATMVFESTNEQRFDFVSINSDWHPIDCDGFRLMMKPAK